MDGYVQELHLEKILFRKSDLSIHIRSISGHIRPYPALSGPIRPLSGPIGPIGPFGPYPAPSAPIRPHRLLSASIRPPNQSWANTAGDMAKIIESPTGHYSSMLSDQSACGHPRRHRSIHRCCLNRLLLMSSLTKSS